MKLSTKLILCFSVVTLLVGGIGLTSSYLNGSVKDQVTTESKESIEEIQLAGEMGLQLYHSFTRTQYLLEGQYRQSLTMNLGRGNLSNEIVVSRISDSHNKFLQTIDQIRELVRKGHSGAFQDTAGASTIINRLDYLEEKFNIYVSLVEQLQTLRAKSYQDGKEFFTVTIEPYFRTSLLPVIENVRKEIQKDHQAKIATLNSQLTEVGQWLGIATFIALAIAISLTFFLYQSIANPLKNLAHAADNIARGDLDGRIDYESNNELGQLSKTFNRMAESLSQTTVSRDYVDSIIESMAGLLVVTDKGFKITRINSAGLAMMNLTEKELLGKQVHSIFQANHHTIFNGTDKKSGKVKSQNAMILKNGGRNIPVSVSKGEIQGRNDEVKGFVIVASDISAEKQAQEKIVQSLKEKEILLAEIHHRVKNNLAVISGLLQMQIWEAENETAAFALQESQLRVQSIALVHEKLYQSESLSYIDFDKYTNELLKAISKTYLSNDSKSEITTDLQPVALNINQAIPCSLLLNELVSNALKHAFKGRENGTIEITMRESENGVLLKVKDNGRGFPEVKDGSKTLGMSLVQTLCKQINGRLVFKNNDGAEVTVRFEKEEVIRG